MEFWILLQNNEVAIITDCLKWSNNEIVYFICLNKDYSTTLLCTGLKSELKAFNCGDETSRWL